MTNNNKMWRPETTLPHWIISLRESCESKNEYPTGEKKNGHVPTMQYVGGVTEKPFR